MLVITRKIGERVLIGNAEVVILRVTRQRVRLGITAPESVNIIRSELDDANDCKGNLAQVDGSTDVPRRDPGGDRRIDLAGGV